MVKIRLLRMGRHKSPYYRIVVADSKSKANGAYIELLGTYNPLNNSISLKNEEIAKWLKNGAQPTDTVKTFLKKAGIWSAFMNGKEIPVSEKKETKKVTKKPISKKAKASDIPEGQKHTIVTIAEFDDYDYDKRRKEWHKKAGHNEKQVVCSRCKDDDNWATIQLEDGKHICYFCWIKKPEKNNK